MGYFCFLCVFKMKLIASVKEVKRKTTPLAIIGYLFTFFSFFKITLPGPLLILQWCKGKMNIYNTHKILKMKTLSRCYVCLVITEFWLKLQSWEYKVFGVHIFSRKGMINIKHGNRWLKKTNKQTRDFAGGPVAKTPCSQGRGSRFNPWLGTRSHMPQLRPRAAK